MTIFNGRIQTVEAYRVDGTDLEGKDKDALQIIVTLQFVTEGDILPFVESDGENIKLELIYKHLKKISKLIENYKVKLPESKVKTSPPDQPNKPNYPNT
ncbi:hypothetical protein [Sphingobacterium sp.]|uniref:hypothetical protein n=1 Tax=Sphingobacterium sp. TaxID=341027 RepID=UPI00289CA0EC|nr:hypothetical protein [Sphingobacterium sp.]